MLTRLVIAAVTAACPLSCGQAVAPRPAQVIYVGEDYPAPFDARRGDTVIVVMDPAGDWVARCLDMGGEPTYNAATTIGVCEGVDF